MSQHPMMPLFPDALVADTMHLSTEHFGAYVLILLATWRNNGQPYETDEELAHICRMSVTRWRRHFREPVSRFFDLSQKLWRQKRLEKIWENCERLAEVSRANGERGGRPRKPSGYPNGFSTETQQAPQQGTQTKPRAKATNTNTKVSRESLVVNTQSPRARARPDTGTRPSLKAKKNQEGEAETRQPPEGWIAEAEAARDKADLPGVNLALEWAKFVARVDGPVELRRWIEWALRAWVSREPHHANDEAPAETMPPTPWANRMRAWRKSGFWMPAFGPPPGEPGCFVPAEFMGAE